MCVNLQKWVVDFTDPTTPMPLSDPSISLLRSGHVKVTKKKGRKRFVREVFVKMLERENDTKESNGQVMERGRGVYVGGLVDRHRSTGGGSCLKKNNLNVF